MLEHPRVTEGRLMSSGVPPDYGARCKITNASASVEEGIGLSRRICEWLGSRYTAKYAGTHSMKRKNIEA